MKGNPEKYFIRKDIIMSKLELDNGIQNSLMILKEWKHHEEILAAINNAINLFEATKPTFENVEKLGEGWTGEEALAISLYCP
jgi:hypothetical protein